MKFTSKLLFYTQKGISADKDVGITENDHCLPIALNEPEHYTFGLDTAWKNTIDTETFFIDLLHITQTPHEGFWVYSVNLYDTSTIKNFEKYLSDGKLDKATHTVIKDVLSRKNGWRCL